MSFLRTLLMFVFVFSLVGVSGSYANKIKNCSNCGSENKNNSKTVIVDNEYIAGSIWTFYEDDGDVRLLLFKEDNTFKYKNVKTYYHMGKVFGDDDERWSITDDVFLISYNGGYNKIYLNINNTRDLMKGVARNKKGKIQKVIGKLEKKEIIFKHGIFFKYRKPSPKKIAKNVAETKKIKIKYADISKPKITKPSISKETNKTAIASDKTINSLDETKLSDYLICYYLEENHISYTKQYYNKNKLNDEAYKRGLDCWIKNIDGTFTASKPKNTKQSISSLELEKEKAKRKALEQRIAELEKKNRELQQPKKIKQKPSNEIGSGFYVSKFRHIVTNQHVVNQCKKITVGDSMSTQIPADLIASDKRNDLAILQTVSIDMASSDTKSFVRKLAIEIVPVLSGGLMRSEDVVGGEEIFVAGFPLANQISDSLKLSDGIVSSTKGYENDVSKFEITSVLRKGNSGGPIYDKKGNIVGVVVEQVNVSRSDNVNFAIKGSTVKQFLSAHNVPTKWSNRQDKIDTKDIYKIASKQSVMVVCLR